jgi:hypothetical protein
MISYSKKFHLEKRKNKRNVAQFWEQVRFGHSIVNF